MKTLEVLNIEKPCTASWAAMKGDDKVRHCGECHLDVYNLSAMTRDEAERVVSSNEGHLCVRVWKRADGTVLTHDCAPHRGEARACVPRQAPAAQMDAARAAAPTRRPERPVMLMGKIAAPTPEAELEAPDAALAHDTVLVELSRAVRGAFDSERVEDLSRSIESALGPRLVGTATVAPETGRNAACPRCEAALWLPPAPAENETPLPVTDAVETRKKLFDELEEPVKASFGVTRAEKLLREILRTGTGTGVPDSRATCPHCAIRIKTPE